MQELQERDTVVSTLEPPQFVCRELRSEEELRDYFHLRYVEYPAANIQIMSNRDQLDIESFDFYAHFVGAFLVEGESKERLVGGVRMVQKDFEGPTAPILRRICQDSIDLRELPSLSKPHPFQLMGALDLEWLLEECEERKQRLVEFGRTVVDRRFRNTGIGGTLVESILRVGAETGADIGFGYCPAHLKVFYERTGCEAVANFSHPVQPWPAVLLKIELSKFRD